MKKQEEMLKCMTKEERHQWALMRLQSYFRTLRAEGFSLSELGQAAVVVGGAHHAASMGKEKTAQLLASLALRIDDPAGEPLPKIDDVPDKPEVVH